MHLTHIVSKRLGLQFPKSILTIIQCQWSLCLEGFVNDNLRYCTETILSTDGRRQLRQRHNIIRPQIILGRDNNLTSARQQSIKRLNTEITILGMMLVGWSSFLIWALVGCKLSIVLKWSQIFNWYNVLNSIMSELRLI